MREYALRGIQKIAQQAARDPTTIRCPRDSAVMRVLPTRASEARGGLDVECPACGRRAVGLLPAPKEPQSLVIEAR